MSLKSVSSAHKQASGNRVAGLALVLALHAAALYAAWSYQLLPGTQNETTLFVNFIKPPPPPVEKKPEPPPPKKVRLEKPRPVSVTPPPILATNAPPVDVPNQPEIAPQPSIHKEEAPSPPPPAPPVGPMMLGSELAVACPQRTAPEYPAISRRLREQGKVILRVELDESGNVASVKVKDSSSSKRLDEAGMEAIKQWHCNAAMRNGEAVRAIALQPFNFVIGEH